MTFDDYLALPKQERVKWGLFYISPSGMSREDWDKWDHYVSVRFPCQSFLRRELWSEVGYFWRKLKHSWYYLRCLIWHRYHIIKIDTDPTWKDADYKIEKALEKLLIDFVEGEKPFERIVWDTDTHREPEKIIKQVYDFFTYVVPQKQKEIDDLFDSMSLGFDMISGKETTDEERAKIHKIHELENKLNDAKTEAYISIILIRGFLWT